MDKLYFEQADAALVRFPSLAERGITPEMFEKFGVQFGKAGSIFIPLFDVFGDYICSIERTASGNPKYLFPSGKSITPFNLNNYEDADPLFVPLFESPFDVFPSLVYSIAIVGLQPTDSALRLMCRIFFQPFVVCYDKDRSGQGAGWLMANRLLARGRSVIVVSRGVLAFYDKSFVDEFRHFAYNVRESRVASLWQF